MDWIGKNQPDKAMTYLQNLKKVNGDDIQTLFLEASIQQMQKKDAPAVKTYGKLLQRIHAVKTLAPPKRTFLLIRIYQMRAAALDKLKRWNQAEKDLRAALKIKFKDPSLRAHLLNHLGYGLLLKNKNIPEALKLLKKAHDFEPKNAAILDSLAYGYTLSGAYKKALFFQEKSLSLDASTMEIRYHLGNIYWLLGAKRQAYFQWRQALELTETESGIKQQIQEKVTRYQQGKPITITTSLATPKKS